MTSLQTVSERMRSGWLELHRKGRRGLTARNLRWLAARPVFAASRTLRRRFSVPTGAADVREVADQVAEEVSSNRIAVPRTLFGYFENHPDGLGSFYDSGVLTLPHRFCVFRVRDAVQLGHTGAVLHLPSEQFVDGWHSVGPGSSRLLAKNFKPIRFRKVVQIPGRAITLLGGLRSNAHYGHFLLERLRHVLMALKLLPELQQATLVVSEPLPPYQETAIQQLAQTYPDLKVVRVSTDVRVEQEELFLPVEDVPEQICWFAQKESLEAVRDLYLQAYGLSSPGGKRRLYLSRNRRKLRYLQNEKEIWSVLSANGYEFMVPEALAHPDQAAAFTQASEIFAPSGSAIASVIFCPKDARLLLTGPSDIHKPFWVGLALAMRLQFAFLPGSRAGLHERFSLPPSDLKNVLGQGRARQEQFQAGTA